MPECCTGCERLPKAPPAQGSKATVEIESDFGLCIAPQAWTAWRGKPRCRQLPLALKRPHICSTSGKEDLWGDAATDRLFRREISFLFHMPSCPPWTASSLEDLADLKNIRTAKQGWLTSAPVTHQGENLFKILFQFVFLNRGVLKSAGRHLIDFNEARGSSWELLFGMNAAFIRSHWKPARFLLNAT